MLVPQVDADGNERDGVRLPEFSVPLATYTGWNLRDPSIGAPDQRVGFEASYIPFPRTADERRKTGIRASPSRSATRVTKTTTRYTKALDGLIKQRWILPEDRAALLIAASRSGVQPQGKCSLSGRAEISLTFQTHYIKLTFIKQRY